MGRAIAGDGDLVWRTIDAHFALHFPEGLERVAFRAARLCEEAHAALTPLLDHVPDRRTHVALTDYGDFANGSATALPTPASRCSPRRRPSTATSTTTTTGCACSCSTSTPTSSSSTTSAGCPRCSTTCSAGSSPNHNVPSFQLEGEAVWVESLTSGQAHPLRPSSAAPCAPRPSPAACPPSTPWSTSPGLARPERLAHARRPLLRLGGPHRGLQAAGLTHDAMSGQLIPFALNDTRASTGQGLTALHAAWAADLRRAPSSSATPSAGSRPRRPSPRPASATSCRASCPTAPCSPCTPPQERYGVWQHPADGSPPAGCSEIDGASSYDLCAQGRFIVYELPQPYREAYSFHDLYLLDLRTGERTRLTRGGRLREGRVQRRRHLRRGQPDRHEAHPPRPHRHRGRPPDCPARPRRPRPDHPPGHLARRPPGRRHPRQPAPWPRPGGHPPR
ncbi:MAG: hypothetical protein R3F43_31290 [bacterium]